MTKIETYPIVCPKCNTSFNADVYESVNVTLNPELLKTIYDRRFNLTECPKCHNKAYVISPFFFHDQNDKEGMILVNPGEDVEFYTYLLKKGYLDPFISDKFHLFLLKFLRFTLKPFGYPKCKLKRVKLEEIDWKKLIERMPDRRRN